MTVGLVLVSHHQGIALGTAELAAQMAPEVVLVPAGGRSDGGIGTDFDRVAAALLSADSGDGVVVICDLGSAILTAETALDFADGDVSERVRIADAAFVEGAVAAAVAAQTGSSLDDVVAAAESSLHQRESSATSAVSATTSGVSEPSVPGTATVSADVVLRNEEGLHARPAADFVRLASDFDAEIRVEGVDAKSLLGIMGLGLVRGRTARIEAEGPDAPAAVSALVALVESGFGEL